MCCGLAVSTGNPWPYAPTMHKAAPKAELSACAARHRMILLLCFSLPSYSVASLIGCLIPHRAKKSQEAKVKEDHSQSELRTGKNGQLFHTANKFARGHYTIVKEIGYLALDLTRNLDQRQHQHSVVEHIAIALELRLSRRFSQRPRPWWNTLPMRQMCTQRSVVEYITPAP